MTPSEESAPSTRRLMRGISLARMLWERHDEERTDRARFLRLIAVTGSERRRLYELAVGDSIIVGRASDSDVQLDATSVSRQHASIEFDKAGANLEDLSSQNGVKINRIPVPGRSVLRDGDRIQIGEQEIHVEMDEQSDIATESELLRRAVKDGVTGVLRDRAFARALEREFTEALRAERSMSLVLVGIENLDPLTEQRGYELADVVLRRVAQECEKAAYEPAGIVGRAEPDVFGIVLAYGRSSDAVRIATRVEKNLQVLADELDTPIRASVGWSTLDPVAHRHAADLVTAASATAPRAFG